MVKGIDYKEVGKRIAERRKLLGMRQKDLAKKAGLEPNTISKIETTETGFSMDSLFAISKALGVGMDYLLSGTEIDAALLEKVTGKLKILTDPKDLKRVDGNIDVLVNIDAV